MKIVRTGFILFFAAFFIVVFDKNNMYHTSMFDMIVESVHNTIDREQYEVVDESFLQPHFTPLPLQRVKKLLDSNKTKLSISMSIMQKIVKKKSHKLKLLVHTNTHNPYFTDKEFFQISSDAISLDVCNKNKKFLLSPSASLKLYIKNNLYTKTLNLYNKKCNQLDTSLLDQLKNKYNLIFSPVISKEDMYSYLNITKEIKLTKNYISKNIFQGIDVVYKKSNFIVLKDLDNRVFIFKGKKLLKVINLNVKIIGYKANFLINGDTLYYTDAKLHLLNLNTLQNKIAPFYAAYFYSIFMNGNNLCATFKKGSKSHALFNDTNYLLIYDKNLQPKKLYSCNQKLQNAFFDKNLFIPYDDKLYKFDKYFKLIQKLKKRNATQKSIIDSVRSLSLHYAPSKKLAVYKEYFAYKTETQDGTFINIYKDFKLIKQIKIPYTNKSQKFKSDFYIDNGIIVYFNFNGHIIFQDLQSQKKREIKTTCKNVKDLEFHNDLLYIQCKDNIVIKDFKTDKEVILPSKNFRFKNLQNIREYMNNKEKVYILLRMSNMHDNVAFENKAMMQLQGNRLTLKTDIRSKIFLINKEDSFSSRAKNRIIPRFAITQNYFIYTDNNAIYEIDKRNFKAIKLTFSINDKIYDIKKSSKDNLLVLTTTKIFLIDLQKKTIIKTLEL